VVVKSVEKPGESSRSIRNIPKKQRINEMIVQQVVEKSPSVNEPPIRKSADIDSAKKSQKGNKRKNTSYDPTNEPEKKKMTEDVDEKILTASAELLNELEVPKVKDSPSTFHKSNDIDKRNLPPKERNKRIFRARNSPEAIAPVITSNKCVDEKMQKAEAVDAVEEINKPRKTFVIKNDLQELMLPHKKKQSSRLLASEKISESIVNEHMKVIQDNIPVVKDQQQIAAININKNLKKISRKSSDSQTITEQIISDGSLIAEVLQSPLRENVASAKISASSSNDVVLENQIISTATATTTTLTPTPAACGQKRHLSKDSQEEALIEPEAKKFHKIGARDSPQPRTLVVACSSETTICITSKGNLAVARRDSLKMTQANSVVVTSQVIITEATKQPIVSAAATPTVPKMIQSKPTITQSLKNALKIPKENMEEMKKQGLLKIENNRTKLTPKGLQKFKEFREEKNNITPTSSSEDVTVETNSSQQESNSLSSESQEVNVNKCKDEDSNLNIVENENNNNNNSNNNNNNNKNNDTKEEEEEDEAEVKVNEKEEEDKKDEKDKVAKENDEILPQSEEEKEEKKLQDEKELLSACKTVVKDVESVNAENEEKSKESTNNEDENDTTISSSCEFETDSKDPVSDDSSQKPLENGQEKEVEGDNENSADDANTGGAGLIALQAETFGGPANCFYLCRQVEDRYEPVDNQILVLNAQNALVPYEGEVALTSTEIVNENIFGYPQMSPNSNIIINTPNGQKIELNHMDILQLQSQADENGIASVALGGEQLELNINGILEAIAAQQEGNDADAMIIEGNETLILADTPELPVEMHSSATQVSETLSKPIMSTTVAPEIAISPVKPTIADTVSKNLNIEDSLACIGLGVNTSRNAASVPKSLELPITVTNPTIAGKV
jgi:hypothetical protein